MGDCDSATVRSATRVPVTMTVSRVFAPDWASAGTAGEASAMAMATASVLDERFIRLQLRYEKAHWRAVKRSPLLWCAITD
ncbi:hypothetical protein D9M71_648870 [compost metagenome]